MLRHSPNQYIPFLVQLCGQPMSDITNDAKKGIVDRFWKIISANGLLLHSFYRSDTFEIFSSLTSFKNHACLVVDLIKDLLGSSVFSPLSVICQPSSKIYFTVSLFTILRSSRRLFIKHLKHIPSTSCRGWAWFFFH